MKTTKIVFYMALAVLSFLIFYVARTLIQAGSFKQITSHFAGKVRVLPIHAGAEDINIDQENGVAFIACDDRRSVQEGNNVQGKIYLLNLNDEKSKPVPILDDLAEDFHPHGIDIWKNEKGQIFLFVVNHRYIAKNHAVEIFEYKNNRLYHIKSVEDPLITNPNDVVALNQHQFYVTNDHGFTTKFWKTLEEYLQIQASYVVFYDGENCKKAAERLKYANGIAMSKDEKQIFVAATIGRKIIVYDRNPQNSELKEAGEIFLGTGGDNIHIDNEGFLWVACHPKMLDFVAHSKDSTKISPSQILKIHYQNSNQYQIAEIYLDDGKVLSGSSISAIYGKKLLIGSVYEPHILICELP